MPVAVGVAGVDAAARIAILTQDLAGSAVSMVAAPANSLNTPRTVVTIAWRAEKPMRVCEASMV